MAVTSTFQSEEERQPREGAEDVEVRLDAPTAEMDEHRGPEDLDNGDRMPGELSPRLEAYESAVTPRLLSRWRTRRMGC